MLMGQCWSNSTPARSCLSNWLNSNNSNIHLTPTGCTCEMPSRNTPFEFVLNSIKEHRFKECSAITSHFNAFKDNSCTYKHLIQSISQIILI